MGRILLGAGLVLSAAGLLVLGLERLGLRAGRLPGDLVLRGRGWTVFASLGTSLLLSLLLSLAFYLVAHSRR